MQTLAMAQIQSELCSEDNNTEVVTIQAGAECECEQCTFRNAVLFLGLVYRMVDQAGLDFAEVEDHARSISSATHLLH